MKVGYVPDSFGQSAQMPQIYRGFGIVDTAFWRGVSDHMTNHTEFNWRGADGSEVFAVNLPFGYYYGGNIPEKNEDLQAFLSEKSVRCKQRPPQRMSISRMALTKHRSAKPA